MPLDVFGFQQIPLIKDIQIDFTGNGYSHYSIKWNKNQSSGEIQLLVEKGVSSMSEMF